VTLFYNHVILVDAGNVSVTKDTKEPAWVARCTSNVISEDDLANDEAICQVRSRRLNVTALSICIADGRHIMSQF